MIIKYFYSGLNWHEKSKQYRQKQKQVPWVEGQYFLITEFFYKWMKSDLNWPMMSDVLVRGNVISVWSPPLPVRPLASSRRGQEQHLAPPGSFLLLIITSDIPWRNNNQPGMSHRPRHICPSPHEHRARRIFICSKYLTLTWGCKYFPIRVIQDSWLAPATPHRL